VFEYVSGEIAADLVNTASWTERGIEDEQLTEYDRLLEWAQGAGAIAASTADSLRRVARARPTDAAAALVAAHRVRGIIQEVLSTVAAGRSPDLTGLNAELARVLPRRQLGGSQWVWLDAERQLESPLWPVVLAAATLLTSSDAARLRVCAKHDCGWMFVDRSRNGLRRWCSMATCGTTEKSRRRAARARLGSHGRT
jgi:predicted RNA-binding Zn ribbon-like protein